MILDHISSFSKYNSLNPLFAKVAEYIGQIDLGQLPLGRHEILGDDLFVNIVDAKPKSREAARIETHDAMIDIQIPISAGEQMGWTPRHYLVEAPYNADDDITFYEGLAQTYFIVEPGQFVIFFPNDGHAPAITDNTLRKAIFKVKA